MKQQHENKLGNAHELMKFAAAMPSPKTDSQELGDTKPPEEYNNLQTSALKVFKSITAQIKALF